MVTCLGRLSFHHGGAPSSTDLSTRPSPFTAGSRQSLSLRGDVELIVFAAGELRRSYSELPVRWAGDLASSPRIRGLLGARRPDEPLAVRTPDG